MLKFIVIAGMAAGLVVADGDWRVQLEADDWRLFGNVKMPGTTQLILGQAS